MHAPWSRFAATLLTTVLVSCGGGGQSAATPTATTPTVTPAATPGPVSASVGLVAGVTTDDPTVRTAEQVDALASLPRRVMARVTLDVGTPVASYVASVADIAKVADVMAEPLDSSAMSGISAVAARARIDQLMGALGNTVSVWEVGNEINGDWVGADAMAKVEAMYDAARSAGRRTALTLYYENPASPGFDMLPWVDAHMPQGHRMRAGLDFVFVSYYEDQNAGHRLTQAELDTIFDGLARRFPNAKVGFGEFGWGKSIPSSDSTRAELIRRFYGYRLPSVPSYIVGGFYWHFRQTMSPRTRPDWAVLSDAVGSFP